MRQTLFLLVLFSCAAAFGRIGETALQFVDRYGPPKDTPVSKASDKNFPLVEGAIHHVYEYQGWRIRAAFLQLDGPAVRMDYSKIVTAGVNARIQDYEVQAIMVANTPPGTSWKQVPYSNSDSPNKGAGKLMEAYLGSMTGQKMWQRSDGAILWLRSPLFVRLELPAARDYEDQLKAEKEQKARASVPQF